MKDLANGTRASYTYDDASRLTLLGNLKSDATVISSFDYAYDAAGNRTRVVETDGDRTTWTYDATYQLLAEHRSGIDSYAHTFAYDSVGNRLTKAEDGDVTTYTYDAANRLRFSDPPVGDRTTYVYDADGNQRSIEEPSGDITTHVWSYENKLIQIELPSDDVVTYTYVLVKRDDTEQRVSKDDDTTFVRFVWDDDRIVAELDDTGSPEAEYTLEPAAYGNLISQQRDAETSYYHYDALGSTRELSDSGEVLTDEYFYYAFGQQATTSGSTDTPYRYVGEQGYYHDAESSLDTLRARPYESKDGRFLSQDPIRDDEENLYRYVGNNPPNDVDPSGMFTLAGRTSQEICQFRLDALRRVDQALATEPFPHRRRLLERRRRILLRQVQQSCAQLPPVVQSGPPVVAPVPPAPAEPPPAPAPRTPSQPDAPVPCPQPTSEPSPREQLCFVEKRFEPGFFRRWFFGEIAATVRVYHKCDPIERDLAREQLRKRYILDALGSLSEDIEAGRKVTETGIRIVVPGDEILEGIEFALDPNVAGGLSLATVIIVGVRTRGIDDVGDAGRRGVISSQPASRDADGRWRDALGRFTRGPAAQELLTGTRTFRRGSTTYTLSQGSAASGWKHIWDRHIDPTRFPSKSKFRLEETQSVILGYLESTIRNGTASTYAGRTILEKRIRMGSQTRTFRATINPDGTVQTFHPLD